MNKDIPASYSEVLAKSTTETAQKTLEELALQILSEAFARESCTAHFYSTDKASIEVTTLERANAKCTFLNLTDDQLTEIYKAANNVSEGKNPPISTKFIFAAMRASYMIGKNNNDFGVINVDIKAS